MSDNIHNIAQKTNNHFIDSTQKFTEINTDISDVSVATNQMSDNNSDLSKSVDDLNRFASGLTEAVGQLTAKNEEVKMP